MKNTISIIRNQKNIFIKNYFQNVNFISLNIYKGFNFNFSKKEKPKGNNHKIVEEKKEQSKREKEEISKQYENISQEDLIQQYKVKTSQYIQKEREVLSKIMSLRISSKLFEDLIIIIKNEKLKLIDISAISMKSSNIININPFDIQHKDLIIKALQTTKLDLQINSEGNIINVIVGPIPKDLKNEILNKIKKIEASFKEEIKKIKHLSQQEIKKLEKIISKDDTKKLEKSIFDVIDKESKQLEKEIKIKIEESNSYK